MRMPPMKHGHFAYFRAYDREHGTHFLKKHRLLNRQRDFSYCYGVNDHFVHAARPHAKHAMRDHIRSRGGGYDFWSGRATNPCDAT